MVSTKDVQNLIDKVDKVTKQKKLDLSSDEDLSIAIMNLISIEEHLFFTAQKTKKPEYLDLLNEIRLMRTELLKKIIKDYEGQVWCISKHLLAASMRVMEVGTKQLKKGKKNEAWELFEKSYKLYNLFWALNLNIIKFDDIQRKDNKINFVDEKGTSGGSPSFFDKLTSIVQKAIDCCKE